MWPLLSMHARLRGNSSGRPDLWYATHYASRLSSERAQCVWFWVFYHCVAAPIAMEGVWGAEVQQYLLCSRAGVDRRVCLATTKGL